MKKNILIHHHIFKNAGTSFNYALKQYFGARFFEYDLPQSQVVSQDILDKFILEHPDALAISSHHACMPTPQGQEYQTISSVFLRKPLDRIRSIYNFERKQDAQTQGAIKAKELDFKEYVVWRLKFTPTMFCNYQTHYCSRTTNNNAKYLPTNRDLEIAIENLHKCTIVGTVERYQETLNLAEAEIKKFYPSIKLDYQYLNATSQSKKTSESIQESLIEDLGEKIVAELENMNQLDKCLYEVANNKLNDRLNNLNVVSNCIEK